MLDSLPDLFDVMDDSQTIEVCFFCDESGQLHSNSPKRYFVIGGYFCLKEHSKPIKQCYTRALKKIKQKRGMLKTEELKTREMTQQEKIKLITSLQDSEGFYGFALVIDKQKMFKRINRESIFYNYGIKLIVQDIVAPTINKTYKTGDVFIEMMLDSRNVSVGHLKSLEDYLNSEYLFSRFEFKADYCDSKIDFRIQATDLIANTIYMLFKEPNLINDVIPYLDLEKIQVVGFPDNKRYKLKKRG